MKKGRYSLSWLQKKSVQTCETRKEREKKRKEGRKNIRKLHQYHRGRGEKKRKTREKGNCCPKDLFPSCRKERKEKEWRKEKKEGRKVVH